MPERINFESVLGLPDPLSLDTYLFTLPRVPGNGDARQLALTCRAVDIPGAETEGKLMVKLQGFTRYFRSSKTFGGGTLNASFLVTRNGAEEVALRNWSEFVTGTKSGNSGGYQVDYSVNPDLTVFDTVGKAAITYRIYNLWLENLAPISLSSDSSGTPMERNATFSFDYCELLGSALL